MRQPAAATGAHSTIAATMAAAVAACVSGARARTRFQMACRKAAARARASASAGMASEQIRWATGKDHGPNGVFTEETVAGTGRRRLCPRPVRYHAQPMSYEQTSSQRRFSPLTLPRGWRDFTLQLLLFFVVDIAYELSRGLADSDVDGAFAHARDVVSAERALGIFNELSVQAFALHHELLL